MALFTARPKVAQLSFQLFRRALHPELFCAVKSHRVERENYRVQINITSDGHVVTWSTSKGILTEIAASSHQLVPPSGQVFCHPVQCQKNASVDCGSGVLYEYETELERVPSELFWLIQKQLGDTAQTHELIHVFDASGRMAIGGLSFVHIETRIRSFHMQAIHTFPDDSALLKTSSTFKLMD
ncbi:MAG: DUF2617 family protein [Planctomycetales bacterium]|nr:DUF2617 family protein [Planctomycetales bacterium]